MRECSQQSVEIHLLH